MNSTTSFLQISPDLLDVTLRSCGSKDEAVQLGTGEALHRLLIDKGIVHGLDPVAIAQAAASIDRAEPLVEPLVLASGTPPSAGSRGMQLYFSTQTIASEETDENGETQQAVVVLTALVHPGDVLAQHVPLTPAHPGKNIFGREIPRPNLPKAILHPGEQVMLDEEKQQLTASVSGYPALSSKKIGTIEHLTLHVDKLIQVTPDRMQALLFLRPAPQGQMLPDQATILRLLDDEGISFGRLPHAVGQCLEKTGREQRPQQAVVALGSLPIQGKDAWLRFAMEIGPLPGKIMGNGEIDFRERNMFIAVNQDQVIAVRIPPTEGTPGRDIFGGSIAQEPGKDIAINVSDDAVYDAITGQIRATRAGVLSKVSEGSVKVCSRQIIPNDVDFETGHINSNAALEIKGSIMPKFKVNALGDILVCGSIEKAEVKSGGNVVVQGGVIGDSALIQAKGDVDIKIIEHGRIFADGSIILRKSGFSCRLYACGDLHAEPSSRIIHSQLVAAGSITTGRVGSDNAEPTLLAAAVSPVQLQLYFDMKRTIALQAKELEALKMRHGRGATSDELDELKVELEENKGKLAHLSLIDADTSKSTLMGQAHALQCTIVVRDKVFAGTEIRIGNASLVLERTMANVRFQLQENLAAAGGRTKAAIIAIPLTK